MTPKISGGKTGKLIQIILSLRIIAIPEGLQNKGEQAGNNLTPSLAGFRFRQRIVADD